MKRINIQKILVGVGLRRRNKILGVLKKILSVRSIARLKLLLGHQRSWQNYPNWRKKYASISYKKRGSINSHIDDLLANDAPLIAVLMTVYDPPIDLLERAIDSVRSQLYPNWQLCIADDASTNPKIAQYLKRIASEEPRLRIVLRKKNGHISQASNSALELVQAKYTALMDHDDLLAPEALYHVATAIVENADAKLLYSDMDRTDLGDSHWGPYLKCRINIDLLLSHNFLCHLTIHYTELIRKLGGFRTGFEGSQDYDLTLRVMGSLEEHEIIHIPYVLYHWRVHPGSTALGIDQKPYALDAGQKAIDSYLKRHGKNAQVTSCTSHYRVQYNLPNPNPPVTLICFSTDHKLNQEELTTTLQDTINYPSLEFISISTESSTPQKNNLSDQLNRAAQDASGDVIVFIDVRLIPTNKDWLKEMVSHAYRKEIGAVGALIRDTNDTICDGGYILGVGKSKIAGVAHKGISPNYNGYMGRAGLLQNLSAVSRCCLAIQRKKFLDVEGFDAQHLPNSYADIDLCLRLKNIGYRTLWTPYAELKYVTEGGGKIKIADEEQALAVQTMRERWGDILDDDPCYSPNLSLKSEKHLFELAWPPRTNSI